MFLRRDPRGFSICWEDETRLSSGWRILHWRWDLRAVGGLRARGYRRSALFTSQSLALHHGRRKWCEVFSFLLHWSFIWQSFIGRVAIIIIKEKTASAVEINQTSFWWNNVAAPVRVNTAPVWGSVSCFLSVRVKDFWPAAESPGKMKRLTNKVTLREGMFRRLSSCFCDTSQLRPTWARKTFNIEIPLYGKMFTSFMCC